MYLFLLIDSIILHLKTIIVNYSLYLNYIGSIEYIINNSFIKNKIKMHKFHTNLSNSNANSTCEFTSNSLRIIQSKQKPSKIISKINTFSPKPKSSFKNIAEINDSIDLDKEIVHNTSGLFDNSLVKNVETMESIFQLKTTERDLLGKDDSTIIKEINDEKDKTNTSIEIDNKPKKSNKKKMILIIGLVVLLIIISFLCGLSMRKYVLK